MGHVVAQVLLGRGEGLVADALPVGPAHHPGRADEADGEEPAVDGEVAEEPDDGDAEHGLPLVAPPPPPRRGARQGRVARTVDRWRRAPRRGSRP